MGNYEGKRNDSVPPDSLLQIQRWSTGKIKEERLCIHAHNPCIVYDFKLFRGRCYGVPKRGGKKRRIGEKGKENNYNKKLKKDLWFLEKRRYKKCRASKVHYESSELNYLFRIRAHTGRDPGDREVPGSSDHGIGGCFYDYSTQHSSD